MLNFRLSSPKLPDHRSLVTLVLLSCALLILQPFSRAQTAVVLAPAPQLQFFDQTGTPLAFGCVFTYQVNTTNPLATYTDYTGNTQNANPITLSAGGSANIWLQAGQAYTFRVTFAGSGPCNSAPGSNLYTVNGIGGGSTVLTTIVPYSATPAFQVSAQIELFQITLTGNASAQPLTFVGVTPPGIIYFHVNQDSSGGHTFSWPSNSVGGCTIAPGSNAVTTQAFVYDGTLAYATGPCVTGNGPTISAGNIFDFGLTANSVVCVDANFELNTSCGGGTLSSVTYNGQTVAPGGSGNVNAGAANHSLALNHGNGSAIGALLLSADQVAVGKSAADPTGSSIPNCTDTSGNHLNYATGGTFSCGTSNPFGITAIRAFSVTGCTPASSTDSQCTGTITVSPAFADATYIPILTANNNGSSPQAANFVVTVSGSLSSNSIPYALSCTFDCANIVAPTIYVIAIHP